MYFTEIQRLVETLEGLQRFTIGRIYEQELFIVHKSDHYVVHHRL